MFASRRSLIIVPVLLLMLLLAACGTQPTEITTPDSNFLLSLARVTIDIDSNGVPSVAGFDTQRLHELTFGVLDLRWMRMDPAYVQWFTDTNLQHVEIVHKDDGLFIFANGQALPHITWTDDSLTAVSDVVTTSGAFLPEVNELVETLIPFIQRVALDVVVRFPVAASAEIVPMREPGTGFDMLSAQSQSALAVDLVLNYDENGEVIASPVAVALLAGMGVDLEQLRLGKANVDALVASGIQHLTVGKQGSGLLLFINGRALPHIAWTNDGLDNSAQLFGQLYYTSEYKLARETVNTVLPLLAEVEGNITLAFPVPDGVKPLPLPGS